MRIAVVAPLVSPISDPPLGGAQAMVADLAAGLAARGHDVHVYAASGSTVPGATVVDTGLDHRSLAASRFRSGTPRGDDPEAAEAFSRVHTLVAEGDHDVVHNHAFDVQAVVAARRCAAPVVHTLHLPFDATIARAVRDAQGDARAPTVVAVSRAQAEPWASTLRIDGVLRNGVPVREMPWSRTAGSGMVFVGRLSPEKGADAALEIAGQAEVEIDLFGDAYDAEYARQVHERAGATARVHPALPRHELWGRMARARALLCPVAWDEPFGLAAAEALACGTPVIGYRRGGLPEVVADGVTGWLVAPGDVAAAARAVDDAGWLDRAACRRHAESTLDLDTALDAHERLYEAVVRTPAAPRRRS